MRGNQNTNPKSPVDSTPGAHIAPHHDDHHGGLQRDLNRILGRRQALSLLGGAGAVTLTACSGGASGSPPATTTDTSGDDSGSGSGSGSSSGSTDCVAYSTETNGPYPADGSNSANGAVANVLIDSGIVKSDMTTSVAGSSGTATGVLMEFTVTLSNVNNSCVPLDGYAIYVWHCDRVGDYSVYNITNENYLRAVGETDSEGKVTFQTIFPGCYPGRWPHIHFEVYSSLAQATHYDNRVFVGQIALPLDECSYVYSVRSDYGNSDRNLANIPSIASDNVFGDNSNAEIEAQTLEMTGNDTDGYTATVTVGLEV